MTRSIATDNIQHNKIEAEKSIKYGGATICYNALKQCWVIPGGGLIFTEKKALNACKAIDEIMQQ